MNDNMKILFVCLGNTCRSPMAEGIMRDLIKSHRLHWEVDSAGLRSWNVGYFPEDRCIKVLSEHGLKLDHLGRELHEGDYHTFDYIFAMDESDLEEIRERSPVKFKAKLELLGSYVGRKDDQYIKDPYHFLRGMSLRQALYVKEKEERILDPSELNISHFTEDELQVAEPGIGGFRRCYDQIYPSLKNFIKLKLDSET